MATSVQPELAFVTPRKLPKASEVKGRVVVLDVAFASEASGGGFDKVTHPFIKGLGARLVAWIDHHDSSEHVRFATDSRFVLSTKAEHGACPEMITPEIVARAGPVDTIVCHTDFDGLASAAKWIRGGIEPYPGADDDARAVDTRMGEPGPVGAGIDRAIRARPRDKALFGLIVRYLAGGLADASLKREIEEAASGIEVLEREARELSARYIRAKPGVAIIDVTGHARRHDKTHLLLLGQKIEPVSVVVDGDTVTVAARFDSGYNFLDLLGLSGGMPTRVSVSRNRLADLLAALGVSDPWVLEQFRVA